MKFGPWKIWTAEPDSVAPTDKRVQVQYAHEGRMDIPAERVCDAIDFYWHSGLSKGQVTAYREVLEPEKHVQWVNMYPPDSPLGCNTRKAADDTALAGRIACIRIEFEEGEGLNDE